MAIISRPSIPEVIFERVKTDLSEFAFNFFEDGVSLDVSARTYKVRLKASGVVALDKASATNAAGRVTFTLTDAEKTNLNGSEYQFFLVEILAGGGEKTLMAGTLRWSVPFGKPTGLVSAPDVSVNYITATQELMVALGVVDFGSMSSAVSAAQAQAAAEQAAQTLSDVAELKEQIDLKATEIDADKGSVEEAATTTAGNLALVQQLKIQTEALKEAAEAAAAGDIVGVGTYNAATGIATIRNTSGPDVTFTPGAVPTLPNGSYLDVIIPGSQSITGQATDMEVYGRVISRQEKWDYLPSKPLTFLDKTVEQNITPALVISSTPGASQSGNSLVIPIGQSGSNSYWGYSMGSAQGTFAGQILKAKFVTVITNQGEITQPIVLNGLAQRYVGGAFQGNIALTGSVVDELAGTTLTRTTTYTYTVTQADIDNGRYYNFIQQLPNTHVVTAAVTITITGSLSRTESIDQNISSIKTKQVVDALQIAANASELTNKQSKYIGEPVTSSMNLTNTGGASAAGNVLTIPIGQTGNGSYYGLWMQSAPGAVVGRKYTAKITSVITNQGEITQPLNFNLLLQRIKNGSFVTNIAFDTSSFVDTMVGSTLTRTYTLTRTITQADVDNGYYYRFTIQLNNAHAVTAAVTVTVSGSLVYDKLLEDSLQQISTNTTDLLSKQNRIIEEFFTSTAFMQGTAGTSVAGNILTIPIGQTGNASAVGFAMPSNTGTIVGRKYISHITLTITNQGEITQPVSFNLILQRLQNGSFVANTGFDSSSFVDSLVGSTLTRTYTVVRTITQSDFDNNYYYRFLVQLNNAHAVTAAVTVAVSGSLVFERLLEDTITSLTTSVNGMPSTFDARYDKTIRSLLGDKLGGMYTGYTVKTVKKDGTGDFTTVQAAINSVADASIFKQYEVLVFDDFEYTLRSQLNGGATGSNANSYAFTTKDYVHVRGNGSMKTISIMLPDDAAANDLIYTQCVLHSGMSRLENFRFVIKNGRYAVHRDDGATGSADDYSQYVNCVMEHLGNQDAVNFASWTSDSALGYGSGSGEKLNAENCVFIARKQPVTSHTNVTFQNPSWMRFVNCRFDPRISTSASNQVAALNASNLGSGQRNVVEFIGCRFGGHVIVNSSWYLNVTNRNDAFSGFWHIRGYNNQPFSLRLENLNLLRLDSAATGKAISVTGGTAKNILFGTRAYKTKKGAPDTKGFTIGAIQWERDKNPYVTNYMQTPGHLLGDCSVVNKTLIVTVDGVDRTITFDKNYSGGPVTAAPAYSYTQILTEINTALSGFAVATDSYAEYYAEITDIFQLCKNRSSSESVAVGMGVIIDGGGYCRKAVAGEKPNGLALEEIQHAQAGINPDLGKVMLKGAANIERWQFFRPKGYDAVFGAGFDCTGIMLKIGSTAGEWVTTTLASEAVLVGIDFDTWGWA